MFRVYDILVLLAVGIAASMSVVLWIDGFEVEAIYAGLITLFILGVGLYFKLLRIVHFVLYRNLEDD